MAARDVQGRWLTSGNPGGRPKVVGLVKEAAQRHSLGAIETLHALMTGSADDRVRLGAAQALLDRGVGKPEKQSNEAANASLAAALEAIQRNARANHAAIERLSGEAARVINSEADPADFD